MPGASEIFRDGLLDGRVAIVTGGGTNLGRQAAAELLACGAQVVIAGRREEVLEAACEQLGEGCSWVAGDIREADDARRIVSVALERHGRLDVLVNNAGGQYFVPAESIAAKGWRAVMRLNVEGTMAMTRAAAEGAFLESGRGGTVINVTVSPHHGMLGMAHTGAARAAVEALTAELAAEWRAEGIAVVAAAIGRFDTESLRKYPEIVTRQLELSVPLQRLGRMEEFAWLVAMLASPLGRALSGTVVTLDGAVDNWWGSWPPRAIVEEGGTVPTEARRP
ncbi:MAG TPA: SDR family NAD(P)-dependent oxidoreductase [Baekduia sp.]|nr:SDR family NAD(P)-dependent oxidoreductase [Baekduia sp.]